MRFRIVLTAVWAVVLGVWAYTDYKPSGGIFQDLHGPTSLELTVLVLGIVVGFAVRRTWVLLALVGPLLALGYLQVTGYIAPDNDGNAPLLSPPGISLFFWYGVALLIGVGLGRLQGIASSAKTGRWSEPGSSSTS